MFYAFKFFMQLYLLIKYLGFYSNFVVFVNFIEN